MPSIRPTQTLTRSKPPIVPPCAAIVAHDPFPVEQRTEYDERQKYYLRIRFFAHRLLISICGFFLALSSHAYAEEPSSLGLRTNTASISRSAPPSYAKSETLGTKILQSNGFRSSSAYIPPVDPTALVPDSSTERAAPGRANYGRPKKNLLKNYTYPKPKKATRPLPPLAPYATSYMARQAAKTPQIAAAEPPEPPPGLAMPAHLPTKTHRPKADEPFAPVGVEVGGVRLRPSLDVSGGYDSNALQTTPRKSSSLVRFDGAVNAQSEWSSHSLTGDVRLGYGVFPGASRANRPDGAGGVGMRFDVTRDAKAEIGGAFTLGTLQQGSPLLSADGPLVKATNRPIIFSFGGYAGGIYDFNRLEIGVRGFGDHTQTQNATFSNGVTQFYSQDNYTTAGVKPRVALALSPEFKPFVTGTIDRRMYDNTYSSDGYRRSSNGYSVMGGARVELFSRDLVGEASGGYIARDYDDPRLKNLKGPGFDASLVWNASPLTVVTLRGATSTDEVAIAQTSGAITRRISGEVSHALMRDLTLIGKASYAVTSYKGWGMNPVVTGSATGVNQRLLDAGIRAEYSLTRMVVLHASYTYERLKTTMPNSSYSSNVVMAGVKLQR